MSVYGYPNADRDQDAKQMNEQLLAQLFEVAAEMGNVPVVVAGDINVQPHFSASLRLPSLR
eukprot:8215316-Karenia_brevis.AAC.1